MERQTFGCVPSPPWKGVLITTCLSCIVSGSGIIRASVGGPAAHPNVACSPGYGRAQDGSLGRPLDPRIRLRLREGKAKVRDSRAMLWLAGDDLESDRFERDIGMDLGSVGLDHRERVALLVGKWSNK